MAKEPSTVDRVYDWAVAHDVPAPDAFAIQCWGLAGKRLRLTVCAAVWRRRVAARKTGFPAIDERAGGTS